MTNDDYYDWDEDKNQSNKIKHGISFKDAEKAFDDNDRIIIEDMEHSLNEERYFCIGKIGNKICTVRFTYRGGVIRIIGAGFWRQGKKRYEQEQNK